MQASKLSVLPQSHDCNGHTLRKDEDGPRVTWVVIFDYPNCTREFDGAKWAVVPKK